jgi:hypothetical protein
VVCVSIFISTRCVVFLFLSLISLYISCLSSQRKKKNSGSHFSIETLGCWALSCLNVTLVPNIYFRGLDPAALLHSSE